MDFEKAEQLLAWMRANGVVSARVGDVALTLADATPPAQWDPDAPWTQYLREKAKERKVYAAPEDDPLLYGRGPNEKPPGWDD